MLGKKLIAEFIGTFFLVFAGTGAIVTDALTKSLSHTGIAMTFGLAVMAMIYTFGHISGGHFNPAVTIAFWIHRDLALIEAVSYVITQFFAAVVASLTILYIFGNVASLGVTLPSHSWQQSFILEFILTFVLMMVIFGSAVHGKAKLSLAGVAIGATVGLEAMFAGPISGASMNPARSFGPAIVSGVTDHLWIYIVATILGSVVSAFVYRILHE